MRQTHMEERCSNDLGRKENEEDFRLENQEFSIK